MSEEQENLKKVVAEGEMAAQFLASKFWLSVLEPMLAEEHERAALGCAQSASEAVANAWSAERLAMKVALLSGEMAAIEVFDQKIRDLVTKGELAAQELQEKKNEK